MKGEGRRQRSERVGKWRMVRAGIELNWICEFSTFVTLMVFVIVPHGP